MNISVTYALNIFSNPSLNITFPEDIFKSLSKISKNINFYLTDLTNAANLKPVVVRGAYKSVDDYVDVYFRLLREDCFHKLKKSIQELVSGTLGKFTLLLLASHTSFVRNYLLFYE